MRINVSEDIRPVSEFRANAAAIIDQLRRTKRPLILTQRGQSAAVLLEVGQYEALLEELETLRDIELAEHQLANGEGLVHSEAQRRVLARLAS